MDGIEAEHEPTNLAPRVGVWVASHIPITEGLMDFLAVEGRRPLCFRRVCIQRAGGTI